MIKNVKRRLYFIIAHYFSFWAKIQLKLWNPKIIVITGSSGKTTTLHLLEAQIGDDAHYSHHANSAYGVGFDILDLHRKTLKKTEWFALIFKAPLLAFKKPYKQKLYVVEVDCDRPNEGKFLASLLEPNGVVWLSSTQTHSANFQSLVGSGDFTNVDKVISFEFGYLIAAAKDFVILNKDNKQITEQSSRTKAEISWISQADLNSYSVNKKGSYFVTKDSEFKIKSLLPQESFYSLEACKKVLEKIDIKIDPKFTNFELPPGRSSIFEGKKGITIVDSSYNSSSDALKAMLGLFSEFQSNTKWLVIGDILEQGSQEGSIHRQAAHDIYDVNAQKIILVGPRLKKHTAPELLKIGANKDSLVIYESPKDALDYILKEIKGNETILFKGARFLEGVVEHLLADKADIEKLCRREAIWQKRREDWGL